MSVKTFPPISEDGCFNNRERQNSGKPPRFGFLAICESQTSTSRTSQNHWKNLKSSITVLSVSFLKPVLQNPDFPRVFCISGQLLWSSVAPMQLGAWAPAALYFASRTPNRVVFRVARVVKSLGFCMSRFGHDPRPWRR